MMNKRSNEYKFYANFHLELLNAWILLSGIHQFIIYNIDNLQNSEPEALNQKFLGHVITNTIFVPQSDRRDLPAEKNWASSI